MRQRIMLVRHASPRARAGQDPASWPLDDAGRQASLGLRGRLPATARLLASGETKAIETLRLAAAPEAVITVDDRFGEVLRPGEPFDDDHHARRLAWVTGRPDARHASWETPDEAARRFQSGLAGIADDEVAVASHGMVITAWLVSIGFLTPGSAAGDFWRRLAFPDLISL